MFGVVVVLGELHVPVVTTKFTFFYYSFVKGIIYFLVSMLCLGMANILGLITAILLMIAALVNCVFGFRAVKEFKWNTLAARGTTTIVTRREYI